MRNDSIVLKVRNVREQIAKDEDYDMHRLFERQKKIFDRWLGSKVYYDKSDNGRTLTYKIAEEHVEYEK